MPRIKIVIPVWRAELVEKKRVIRELEAMCFPDWHKLCAKGIFNYKIRDLIAKIQKM